MLYQCMHMTSLSHNVTINGTEQAHKAGDWCNKHITPQDWNITIPGIGQPIYRFSFARPEDANWFTLKWQ